MDTDAPLEAVFGAPSVTTYMRTDDSVTYDAEERPRRDTVWTITYGLLAALTLAGSIPVFLRTDPHTGLYSNRFFNSSTSCDIQRYQQVAWMYNDAEYDPTFMRRFKAEVTIWLPATAGLALLVSALYLALFSRLPRALLGVVTLGSLVAGSAMCVLCFTAGALPAGILLVGCTALATGFFAWVSRWRHTLAQLMTAAADRLRRNQRLLAAALGIQLGGLLLLSYGFAAFFSAVNIGYVSRNWDAAQRFAVGDENGFCMDAKKHRIPCCIFVTHSWAYAFAAAAAIFVAWSAALVLQLKTFTAADTLAQSYFGMMRPAFSFSVNLGMGPSPRGMGLGYGEGEGTALGLNPFPAGIAGAAGAAGSVRRALRHCLAASFGSLALAGLALTPLRAVRWTSQALLRLRGVGRAAGCVLRPLASATEKFNRFTAVAAAITGRPFLSAARSVFQLLQRNVLPPYGLWWVPDWTLTVAAALLSLAWSGLVFFVTYLSNKQYSSVVLSVSFATASASFLLMLYGLLFTMGLQLDVVHTLYVCYAIDKDQGWVTHPDLPAVIHQVPGQWVQNRRSGLVYSTSSASQRVPAAAAAAATAAPEVAMEIADAVQLPPASPGLDGAEAASPRSGLAGFNPSRLKRRAS